jgi:ferrous-iron efflux pump FieF
MHPDITLHEAHILSDRVELALRRAFPQADVIIHQDPHGIVEHHHPVLEG